ncbi:DUF6507 family protein [Arthrobacter sp. zg-Y1143]|uniref:DUF6507 family protein n=1 Tax=Arthrobacter sp. zg-Y1143 TaxID=3049065 RepID=UPI0024C39E3E|nr:DUF6507 family protein [Arthrobacter sp. zg-Y1143]MDK1327021.1 DUF6507 family protein [Arthrobacter sp. zg-Y1143]
MGLNGYSIDVATCSGILARARDDEGVWNAIRAVDVAYDDAANSCGSAAVAAALIEVGEMLSQQGQFAAARVENAVDGVGQAVSAYIQGDMDMAESGRRSVNQVPQLDHDPAASGARSVSAVS